MKRHFSGIVGAGAVLLSLTFGATAGPPLRITFHNASSSWVTSLKVRITGAADWGANRISGKGLASGQSTQLMLADGVDKCVDDVWFTTSDGQSKQLLVRFCGNPSFTYYGRP